MIALRKRFLAAQDAVSPTLRFDEKQRSHSPSALAAARPITPVGEDEGTPSFAAAPPKSTKLSSTTDNQQLGLFASSARGNQVEGPNQAEKDEPGVAPENLVALQPPPTPPSFRFELLNQWECEVTAVDSDGDSFDAVMTDLTNQKRAEETATFYLSDVSESDKRFVEPGYIFYLSVGYDISMSGQKRRASDIRFRRLPAWTRSEIQKNNQRAESVRALFAHTEKS